MGLEGYVRPISLGKVVPPYGWYPLPPPFPTYRAGKSLDFIKGRTPPPRGLGDGGEGGDGRDPFPRDPRVPRSRVWRG